MTPTEMADAIERVRWEVATWTTDPRDWGRADIDRAVEVWHRMEALNRDLAVLRRDHSLVLAKRTDDEFTAFTRDGHVTIHTEIETSDQWDGDGVIADLAQSLITADGEVVDAVPADVLRDVLPACSPGATSSKWKVTSLRKRDPSIEQRRRQVKYGDRLVALGGKRAAQRNRKPVEPPNEDVSTGFGGRDVDNLAGEAIQDDHP